jgi:N-acetylmuramoyl-L-alanine amidase
MENIYLSPSSQPANTYAVGNTNEQEQCRKIAAALEKELDRCGFNSKAGMTGSMYTRVAESNAFNAGLHLPIHTNACDGKVAGLRIFVYKKGGEAEKIAKSIMDTLAPITPGKSDGISAYPGLYEVKSSKAICVYIEVGFHDNPEEAKWIIEHTKDIAVAIAKGLCNHYGVKYVAEAKQDEPAKEESKTIYRVQVGAFSVKKNAEAMLKKLQAAGFADAFIKSN